MTTPTHPSRHVDTVHAIDIGADEKEIKRRINRTLTRGDIRRVIVMPSSGVIHIFRTAYHYSEDRRHMPQALATALHYLGFFKDEDIPTELVTPVDDMHPQYLVELTTHPDEMTCWRLMK
ncbi:MAG: hypothetical protein JWM07_679 [Candidatus Saccharibacteria bacterium]|jgi:hypothetical protein|nr:hypothetical protein [Candidatus Saccharibacteria bacterium]